MVAISQESEKSLRKFLEPSQKPKVIYTGDSLEFGKSCEELSWNHRTSTPYRSVTNGIAERSIRRVKERTSAVLVQSGVGEKWWADSVERCSYLRNVQDLLADGKTPFMKGVSQHYVKVQQFLLVQWLNTILFLRGTIQDSINLVGKCYLEYSLDTHCVREDFGKEIFWSQTLRRWKFLDASEILARRLNAKGIITPKLVNT